MLLVVVAAIMCCMMVSFADEVASTEQAAPALTGFFLEMKKVFQVVQAVVTPVASVAVAFCALWAIIGSQKEAERAVGTIKIIIIACVCIWLLPLMIAWGRSLGAAHGYIAPTPMTIDDLIASASPTGTVTFFRRWF